MSNIIATKNKILKAGTEKWDKNKYTSMDYNNIEKFNNILLI